MAKSPDAFRTISEVAELLDVPAHVLRFWESRFTQVKPIKRAGGRRYYRRSDILLLDGIRKLLHDDGLTIRGVQKLLREEGVRRVAAHGRVDLVGDEDEALDAGLTLTPEDAPEAPMAEDVQPEPEDLGQILPFPLRVPPRPIVTGAGVAIDAPELAASDEDRLTAAEHGPEAEPAAPFYPAAEAKEAEADFGCADPAPPAYAGYRPAPETQASQTPDKPAPAPGQTAGFTPRPMAGFEDTGPLIEAYLGAAHSEPAPAAAPALSTSALEAPVEAEQADPEPIETEAERIATPEELARQAAAEFIEALGSDPEDSDPRFALPPLPLGRLHPGLPGLRPLYARLRQLRQTLGESSRRSFASRG